MKKSPPNTPKFETILVLDDNAEWRRIVKSILESDLGVSPLVASSGREALDIVKAHQVNVVVADLNMPVMNGVQFMESVRPLSPKTRVIIMSADLGVCPTMSQELIARGAFAVIPKIEIASNLISLLRP